MTILGFMNTSRQDNDEPLKDDAEARKIIREKEYRDYVKNLRSNDENEKQEVHV